MDCADFCQVVVKPFEDTAPTPPLQPQSPLPYALTPSSTSSFASDSPDSQSPSSPDAFPLSSLCHHYAHKMRITPLDSPSSDSSDHVGLRGTDIGVPDSVSDEEILDSIYQSLMEAIVSLQFDGNLTDFWSFDGCKTPLSVHCTNHSPDTCPGAPMKLTRISRNIDSGLRRKLF